LGLRMVAHYLDSRRTRDCCSYSPVLYDGLRLSFWPLFSMGYLPTKLNCVQNRGMFHDSLFKHLHITLILLIILVLTIVIIVREDFMDILDNNPIASTCSSCGRS